MLGVVDENVRLQRDSLLLPGGSDSSMDTGLDGLTLGDGLSDDN